jgi:hypothetical protein
MALKIKKHCFVCNKIYFARRKISFCCSPKCSSKRFYLLNKKRYIERARIWDEKNPIKSKENHKKAFKKFYTEKPEQFKNLMKRGYKNNKDKWNSRAITRKVILGVEGYAVTSVVPKKFCKECGRKRKLEIHHEIYPLIKEDILKAIKNGKIYYLCKKCHNLTKKEKGISLNSSITLV